MFTKMTFKVENAYIWGKKVDNLVPSGIIVLYISAPWRKQKLTILMILPKGYPFLCYVFHNI